MYDLYIVRRTQIYLDEEQDRILGERARATGATKSALIRAAVDAYLSANGDDHAELLRFRAAVNEAAGVAPYLPPGREYVEALRAVDRDRERELERRWRSGA